MSLIIFDFDGTIADSFAYVFDFLAGEAGKQAKQVDMESLRQTSMKDMARALGIPYWRLPFVYFKGRQVMRGHMLDVKPFTGMPETIRQLKAAGHSLAIVSSNSNRNIKQFIKHHELHDCIRSVRGGAGLLGKVSLIKQLQHQYHAKDSWYIGDETTDIASAKAAGSKSLAVTWGFANRQSLARFEPAAIVDKAADIVQVVSGS